jgi:hypothetical protein
MSDNTTAPAKAAIVPSITGNPMLDTALRNGIITASAALAAIIVTWLNSKGFSDPNLTLLVSGAIASVLTAIAAIAWGIWQTRKSQQAIVNNTVHAALTGEVSAAIVAQATPEQAKAIQAAPNTTVR